MKYLQNLHTHTKYCDGADTPEEMIEQALKLGFDTLGFSGHSYMFYSPGHSMSIQGTQCYKQEIKLLKDKYAGSIRVLCGLELDMYSEVDLSGYDYIIGSLHYLRMGGEYVGFDRGADEVERVIREYFGGDGMRYACEYYAQLAQLSCHMDFDIAGHIDIITKHAENRAFFDWDSREYMDAASQTIELLCQKGCLFEINTGAIARGYRTTPYPSMPLLRRIRQLGGRVIISSDCHDRNKLDMAFDDALDMMRAAGFNEVFAYGDGGFVPLLLD